MSTQQLHRRVQKVEEKACPEHNGLFTWEQFNQLFELLRQDPQEFHERAKQPDGAAYRAFLAIPANVERPDL